MTSYSLLLIVAFMALLELISTILMVSATNVEINEVNTNPGSSSSLFC